MANDENPFLPLGSPNGNDGGGNDGTGGPTGASSIIPINIEDEMRRSYLDYSMSVIIGRALPDIRDGLKPVHRRILYTHERDGPGAQQEVHQVRQGSRSGDGRLPSPRRLGDLRHDGAAGAAVSLRYPLIDGQGNFGSVDGDPPAAMRYTECRLKRIAGEMLADIDMETVDFVAQLR